MDTVMCRWVHSALHLQETRPPSTPDWPTKLCFQLSDACIIVQLCVCRYMLKNMVRDWG